MTGGERATYGLFDVEVRYGSTAALRGVTVAVPSGAIVAVVGGDGAGKTTAMRALVGQVRVDRGGVVAPAAERIGYLHATAGSWASLTVTENLEFAAASYGMDRATAAARMDELLRAADLTDARDRLASQLSGGMRRKLGCIMAMLHRPDLLVVDEPSTGVDPVSRVELWRLIAQAAAGGAAVVMTTTYLDEAERATAIVALDRGTALVSGNPQLAIAELGGTLREVARPERQAWAWRRGRVFHEWWPPGHAPAGDGGRDITPDLEDVVIALAIRARETEAGS